MDTVQQSPDPVPDRDWWQAECARRLERLGQMQGHLMLSAFSRAVGLPLVTCQLLLFKAEGSVIADLARLGHHPNRNEERGDSA